MPAETHTFKERAFECAACATTVKALSWSYAPVPTCSSCNSPMTPEYRYRGLTAGVISDECNWVAEHGIPPNPDGTPRRYNSKSAYYRDAAAHGWVNRVEHKPLPGGDSSKHTSRWI